MPIRDGSGFGSNALAETAELARTAPDMGAELRQVLYIMRGRWRTFRSSDSAAGISFGCVSRVTMPCTIGSAESSLRLASTGGSEPRPLPTLFDGAVRNPAPRLFHTRRIFFGGENRMAARYLYPAGGTRARNAGETHGRNARAANRKGAGNGSLERWQMLWSCAYRGAVRGRNVLFSMPRLWPPL